MEEFIGPRFMELRKSVPHIEKVRRATDLPNDTLSIIALDPGGITGWSVLVLRKEWLGKPIWEFSQDVILRHKVSWFHGEIDCRGMDLPNKRNMTPGTVNGVRGVNTEELKGSHMIKKLIDQWPDAAVVIEGFQLRQMAVDLSPVRIIARIENYLWYNGRNMFTQMPAMKATASDARLKEWGCYTATHSKNEIAIGGSGILAGHARDADRHALMFLRKCMGDTEFRKVAWPHLYLPDMPIEIKRKKAANGKGLPNKEYSRSRRNREREAAREM